jgi:hypothetical protein
MSCARESLLTIVTRLPAATLMLFGETTPPLEIVMVVVSTGVVVVVVGEVGEELLSPPPQPADRAATINPHRMCFCITANLLSFNRQWQP